MAIIVVGIRAGCIIPVASDIPIKLVVYDFDLDGVAGDPATAPEARKVDGELCFADVHEVPLNPEKVELYTRIAEKGGSIKEEKEDG